MYTYFTKDTLFASDQYGIYYGPPCNSHTDRPLILYLLLKVMFVFVVVFAVVFVEVVVEVGVIVCCCCFCCWWCHICCFSCYWICRCCCWCLLLLLLRLLMSCLTLWRRCCRCTCHGVVGVVALDIWSHCLVFTPRFWCFLVTVIFARANTRIPLT